MEGVDSFPVEDGRRAQLFLGGAAEAEDVTPVEYRVSADCPADRRD